MIIIPGTQIIWRFEYTFSSLSMLPSPDHTYPTTERDNYFYQILGKVSIKSHRSAIEKCKLWLVQVPIKPELSTIIPRWDARDSAHEWLQKMQIEQPVRNKQTIQPNWIQDNITRLIKLLYAKSTLSNVSKEKKGQIRDLTNLKNW